MVTLALYRTRCPAAMLAGVCQTVYVEQYPRDCPGCGLPYLRGLVQIGHSSQPSTRTLTCRRGGHGPEGCGHVWYRTEEWPLLPVLRRCRDRRCPTWRTAEPDRPPFPASDAT